MPKNRRNMEFESDEEISKWVDDSWEQHILACLAIINSGMKESEQEDDE